VKATNKIEDIIAARPDCVLYTPLLWDVDAMVKLLESGINVISTANFITGRSYGRAAVDKLEKAAQKGKSSASGTGINPGLANVLCLVTSASCATIKSISVLESVDATKYASPDTWKSLGFGGPASAPGLADIINQRTLVFTDSVEMMAEGLAVKIDDIVFKAEYATYW
jgi:2,4-diaminopentanoate dehydrogenase